MIGIIKLMNHREVLRNIIVSIILVNRKKIMLNMTQDKFLFINLSKLFSMSLELSPILHRISGCGHFHWLIHNLPKSSSKKH